MSAQRTMVCDQHRIYATRYSHALLGVALVLTLLTGGCSLSDKAFFKDHRLQIISPKSRSLATLPVTLKWQASGFRITGRDGSKSSDSGYFAVFVDRHPIPPGKTLEWYATQPDSCGGQACETVDNLSDIFTTRQTTLELHRLPVVREITGKELHTIRIVFMDGSGARIGESVFRSEFYFDRKEWP